MTDKLPDLTDVPAKIAEKFFDQAPLYKDGLQPAVQAGGKGLGRIAEDVWDYFHSLMAPVRLHTQANRLKETQIGQQIEERSRLIPEDRRQLPVAYIAGPALEAMRFAQDDPELRKMYVNLLSTAMDREFVEEAHPAFVEIIKQLTPDEGRLIGSFAPQVYLPILTVRKTAGAFSYQKGYQNAVSHFSLLGTQAGCVYPNKVPLYLNNLSRLGLVEIPDATSYQNTDVYKPLILNRTFRKMLRLLQEQAGYREMETVKKLVHITELGRQFYNACACGPETAIDSTETRPRWSEKTPELKTLTDDPHEIAQSEIEANNNKMLRDLQRGLY